MGANNKQVFLLFWASIIIRRNKLGYAFLGQYIINLVAK